MLTLWPSAAVFHIGRHPGNDRVIDDPWVSRRHLQWAFVDPQWGLQDCSTHGTSLWPEEGDRPPVHHQAVIVRGRGLMALRQALSAENPDVIHYERGEAEADRGSNGDSATSPESEPSGEDD